MLPQNWGRGGDSGFLRHCLDFVGELVVLENFLGEAAADEGIGIARGINPEPDKGAHADVSKIRVAQQRQQGGGPDGREPGEGGFQQDRLTRRLIFLFCSGSPIIGGGGASGAGEASCSSISRHPREHRQSLLGSPPRCLRHQLAAGRRDLLAALLALRHRHPGLFQNLAKCGDALRLRALE